MDWFKENVVILDGKKNNFLATSKTDFAQGLIKPKIDIQTYLMQTLHFSSLEIQWLFTSGCKGISL